MKYKILIFALIFPACATKNEYHTKSFVNGCVIGSSVFIQMQTRKNMTIQQRYQLREFCTGLEKGFQAELSNGGQKI